jgi:hypothetical protein
MKTYHIVYFTPEERLYSKGTNINALSMIDAILIFQKIHPNIEPYFIVEK